MIKIQRAAMTSKEREREEEGERDCVQNSVTTRENYKKIVVIIRSVDALDRFCNTRM